MGSNKRLSFCDNSSELFYNEAGAVIKAYFLMELPSFKFVREYNDPRGYWGFYFSYDNFLTMYNAKDPKILYKSLGLKNQNFCWKICPKKVYSEYMHKSSLLFLHFLLIYQSFLKYWKIINTISKFDIFSGKYKCKICKK